MKNSGFSLIELISVIVIISVMTFVVTDKTDDVADYKSILFLAEVEQAVKSARMLAINSSCNALFKVDDDKYSITQQASCNSGSYSKAVKFNGVYEIEAPEEIINFNNVSVYFDPLGRATTSGGSVSDYTVTVGEISLDVIGETGYVQKQN